MDSFYAQATQLAFQGYVKALSIGGPLIEKRLAYEPTQAVLRLLDRNIPRVAQRASHQKPQYCWIGNVA